MTVRRGIALLGCVVALAGCRAEDPVESTTGPTPEPLSMSAAWRADAGVRPDWVGPDQPWLWATDQWLVVIGERRLVALDPESGEPGWTTRLPGRFCAGTPTVGEGDLVALAAGPCGAALQPTRSGGVPSLDGPARAERTTLLTIDLSTGDIVWREPMRGVPALDAAGDTVLVRHDCFADADAGIERVALSDGSVLGAVPGTCEDRVVSGDGDVAVQSPLSPDGDRVTSITDIASGDSIESIRSASDPGELIGLVSADPAVLHASVEGGMRSALYIPGRTGEQIPPFEFQVDTLIADGDLVVAAGTWLDQERDGTAAVALTGLDAEPVALRAPADPTFVPFAIVDHHVLAVAGSGEELLAGTGDIVATRLDQDADPYVVHHFEGPGLIGETNLLVHARKFTVLGDLLLVPGHGNQGVLTYRLS